MKTRRFAVFDIDGTLIRWQMLHAIIDRLGRAGHFSEPEYASILAARKAWKERKTEESFKEYEMHLIGVLVANLKQLHVKHFDAAVQLAFADYKDQAYRYTSQLIRDLQQKGCLVFAVSGAPTEIVALLAEHYGFDDFIGTDHLRSGASFTGEVMVAVRDKPKHLRSLMGKHQVSLDGSIGVGDSEGDIDMLSLVEHPIAFNPSKKLFHHAQTQGWKVVIERKNMIYELEHDGTHYQLTHTNDKGEHGT